MRRRGVLAVAAVASTALLACGRDLAGPFSTRAITTADSVPEALALVAANRDLCSIVIWDRSVPDGAAFVRVAKRLPSSEDTEGKIADDAAPAYGLYRHRRWSKASHDKIVDAVCVVPLTPTGQRNAAQFFAAWHPPTDDQLRRAAAVAGVRFSWESGYVSCDYCPADDHIECEGGVYCTNAEQLRAPVERPQFAIAARPGESGLGPKFSTYNCDNDCNIYDFSGYTCAGGGGDTDFGGGGDGGGSGLTLDCSQTEVQRLTSVTCTASATQGGDSASYAFTFEPSDGSLNPVVRGSGDVSSSWGGTMVTSGSIMATAIVGHDTLTASKTITVTARSWSNENPVFPTPNYLGTGDLRAHPEAFNDLGNTDMDNIAADGITQSVSSGPNAGMYYTTAMFTQLYDIQVNETALSTISDLASIQSGGSPACSASDLNPTYRNFVKAHEGTTYQSGSHTDRHKTYLLGEHVGPIIEAIVTQYPPSAAQIRYYVQSALDAAKGYSEELDDPPPTGPCNLTLFQP